MTHNTREGCRHCEVAAEQGVTHIHDTIEIEKNQNYHNPIYSQAYLHHQLQKAREEERETFRKIVQANLDKYCIYEVGADALLHSELDQDKK